MSREVMTCARFSAWLDAGRPETLASEAAVHAASCEGCRAALAADRALEQMLAASPSAKAPPGFTDRVMRAVEVADETRAHAPAATWTDAMPWWARAAMQPSALGAATLAALLVWRPDAIDQGGRLALSATLSAWQEAVTWLAQAAGPASAAIASSPLAQIGLASTLAILLAFAAQPLYRWTEKAALRGA